MPLTPFLGLSVFVHITVIIGYYFFQWTPDEPTLKEQKMPKLMRVVGIGIISVVFMVVLASATVLVRASILDKHSSVRFASGVAENIYADLFDRYSSPSPANSNNIAAMSVTVATQASAMTMPTSSIPSSTETYAVILQQLQAEEKTLVDINIEISSSNKSGISLDK